ncbi:Origin recognition complex subunit 2 [Friedmanniomyces endolithicus]|uniref:Origin recognition complex subunit 2 n=1 Tax=Friedmanniomyces endolithicus TaxID=329885 RepID=A0AAN6QU41_9PEZI|nr:Origin recognition complex subunit 2 [Friedmanniomyces endolithicus]KAK0799630.1 Origin recognition complex subunit 2 [Friedmanniomyces endolithicus]KAK0800195.1 Origin recognition complex subunit 2 [Friedmanniomyces endolithicus]KAK0805296.1 Origin recognition complex subunit 2 [Friedmanniomyces endolithicus]KAK0848171.1 Origin recognition complex subunit 2 [Friedmanniomyces endolithicus]
MPKRKAGETTIDEDLTPRKIRKAVRDDAEPIVSPQTAAAETPSGRKSILRGTPRKLNGIHSVEATPKSLRKVLFTTPLKPDDEVVQADEETPTAVGNDRSARRKSQRVLQTREESDDEDAEADEAIAQQILEGDAYEEDDEEASTRDEPGLIADTPSKSGKLRGRPKGRRRERTPSPAPDLPPHELYFFQNRAGGNKTSANTLPSHVLLDHDDYFAKINAYEDPHVADVERLKRLHKRSFDQWIFELEEGLNICLYGYGSKRELVMEFAEYTYGQAESQKPRVIVVNGYTPGLTVRDILVGVGSLIAKGAKLPAQPAAMLDLLMLKLEELTTTQPILLIIHSLDHANLRKSMTQAMIARLVAHPSISLLATCDTPNFPLLWDVSLTRQLRFLYHDTTTFQPYRVEIDVVEEVNALLGRSRRRLGGKDGVAYVLKSLPENARNLFKILVEEQIGLAESFEPTTTLGAANSDDDLDPDDLLGASDDEAALAEEQNTPSRRARGRGRPAKKAKVAARPVARAPAVSAMEGVEYRALYHKAVEAFVCSSELAFRTLLKEFHDHAMVESRRDAGGTERLSVPMGREELRRMVEELE